MTTYRLVCMVLIWAIAVSQVVRVLMLGRKPPFRDAHATSPRLFAFAWLLIPTGCTLGLFSPDGGPVLWMAGTALLLVGLLLTGWACRKPRARA
ncbi:hypothetical protein ACIQF6_17185 [Kitasatospora sp. NPDC092948]|uniref:hypothetical protein n=1 Tax=Kitasatospora sp. NPDC092948 TaxID=3364088 RepID=UPI0038250073